MDVFHTDGIAQIQMRDSWMIELHTTQWPFNHTIMCSMAVPSSYTGECLDQCWLDEIFSGDHTNYTVVFVNYR